MPQVPFQGVPTISPSIPDTPRYTADTPPAAFGTNIAQAVEGLGKTAEGVGNEIFARGIAMQDLYNHSEAQAGDAAYMQKAGELHADYSAKQGKDAVDAYPQYIKDLQTARTQQRDALSNPMSQKLYDSSSLSTMGRTIFNGAGHAATQNKVYAVGSSKARVAAMGDQALANPADDNAFQDNVQDTEDEVRAQGQLQGWGKDQTDQAVAERISGLWGQRIQGLVKTNPLAADKMLKGAIEDGSVQGEDIAKLSNLVQANNHTVGARMISHEVMTGAGNKWGEGTVDIKQAATAISNIESGGNYDTQVDTGSKHGVALGKYGVMSGYLPEFLQQAGMPPMTSDEFIKNHAAQDQLFATRFSSLMKETGSANGAAARWIGLGKPDAFGTDATSYVARFNNQLGKNAPLSAQTDMGARLATERAPDDPLLPDFVRDRISADHSKVLTAKRDDIWQAQQPIENTLVGAMSKDGKIPTTVEELTADPQVSAAWDKLGELNPTKQRYYLNVLARNAKGDHALTPTTLKQYTGFTGEAISRPADFVNENILDTDLPIAKKAELIKLQQSIQGKTDKSNPAVMQAMRDSADIINAAGISSKNKDDYDQFTGQLADQLRQWSQDNQKPPNYEQRQVIVSRLLQQQHSDDFWFKSSTDYMYKIPVPSEIKEQAKKLNPNLTDEQIQREYSRQQYNEFYAGSTKSAKAPTSK